MFHMQWWLKLEERKMGEKILWNNINRPWLSRMSADPDQPLAISLTSIYTICLGTLYKC